VIEKGPKDEARRPPNRASFTFAQLYYYLAALTGVAFVLVGAIDTLFGIRARFLPAEMETGRDAMRQILHGVSYTIMGAACLTWHLREARKREALERTDVFWGRSLYLHTVALVGFVFVLTGLTQFLQGIIDAHFPYCFDVDGAPGGATECFPIGREATLGIVEPLIIFVVGLPIWLWHLREGRRAARPSRESL
jgi:uncharacterized protein DUF5671